MFLTVKETSELLRMSERHTYKLIKEGEIPHIRIKGKILINKDSLFKQLEEVK